uniref:F-box domain-containing protein n=1 Tax=Leersia perrieri TaxID=77586 RepID=A0A0D9XH72_9ORYZ
MWTSAGGLPLGDEVILLVMSLLHMGDLVRCAATCRRWRRLISSDAAFLCQRAPTTPSSSGRCISSLALGFFLNHKLDMPNLLFVPRRPQMRMPCKLGRVVVEVGGRSRSRLALRLCVSNPMTGELHSLPHLRRPPLLYACALLTADDNSNHINIEHTWASSFVVVVIYNRRGFTAARCFSSDTGQWGAEARVKGARVGRMQQHAAAIVVDGGGLLLWPRLSFALVMPMMQGLSTHRFYGQEEGLLGLLPDGRLCWDEVSWNANIRLLFRTTTNHGMTLSLRQTPYESLHGCKLQRTVVLGQLMPELSRRPIVPPVKLRCFSERSGLILFTAANACYTLNVLTMEVDKRPHLAHGTGHGLQHVCL